jgi:DNA-binding FadR family transcriptional regulator
MVTLRLRKRPTTSTQEHHDLLNAIREGDWRKARTIHYQHRMRASDELTQILEKFRLPHL